MGKTFKTERARALRKAEHKDVPLIKMGSDTLPNNFGNFQWSQDGNRYLDTGGNRSGNNRKMLAEMKVDERRKDRKVSKRKSRAEVQEELNG